MKKGNVGWMIIGIILFVAGFYRMFDGLGGVIGDKTPQSTTSPASINEFVADRDGVEFCVTKVDNLKSVGSGYYEVKTENNFVVVSLTIRNNGTEPYDVNSIRFVLMNGELEYQDNTSAALSIDNGMFMDTINPGLSKEYTLVYETPMTTHEGDFKLKIKYISFLESECVYISLADTK